MGRVKVCCKYTILLTECQGESFSVFQCVSVLRSIPDLTTPLYFAILYSKLDGV